MLNQPQPIQYEERIFNPLVAFQGIKKFIDKFDRDNWQNPKKYEIVEYFPFEHPEQPFNTYDLYNITVDIENDEIAYFNDEKGEGILMENMYKDTPLPLQTIIIDNVEDASINEYYKWITITYANGFIRIKY